MRIERFLKARVAELEAALEGATAAVGVANSLTMKEHDRAEKAEARVKELEEYAKLRGTNALEIRREEP